MIDWERSESEFLISGPDEISVKRRPRVAVICDGCGKSGTKTMRHSSDLCGDWLCRKCAMNVPETKDRVHKAIAKFNKREYSEETKKKMANNLSDRWKDPEFRSSVTPKISSNMKSKWKDEDYRSNISSKSKEKWENKEYRSKIIEFNVERWRDSEFRSKMLEIQSSESYKKKISEAHKLLWADEEYRAKMIPKLIKARQNVKRVSSLQLTLYSILDDLGVEHFIERNDGEDDPETKIGPHEFDCVVPRINDTTLLIECNGLYWHSSTEQIANDKAKSTYIERYHSSDYEIKYLWEQDFKCRDKIIELVKYWLGISEMELVDFAFENVEIRDCPAKDYRLLLSKYHYLPNAGRGGISFGAYLGDELVAVCVFSPLVRQNLPWDKKTARELSRLCIHPRYQKKNFASWFVSRCIKALNPQYKTIISYCDTTFNHDGATYKACNFKLDGEVKPDYWYEGIDGWVTHKKTLYNMAVKMGMKEKEFAEKLGHKKVYGKKKLRFIYER